ncbi:MAG: helix-turn-helix domain-containing protein [Gemella sp.]|nr:helix-turn-helix domain-containing protein [Gemella sp.]
MNFLLATRLKNRRIELKLSQAQLAEGICKQGQISRIEQGSYSPGAELLYQLSKRLNVPLEYFFDETVEEESPNLKKFKELSRVFLNQRNYENLKYIYELEIQKNQKLALTDRIYLSWIKAILVVYLEKNYEEGIKNLEDILAQINEKDSLYLTVAISLLNIYYDYRTEDGYEEFYRKISEIISNITIVNLYEIELVIRFKYNYCHHLWKNSKLEEAITAITETISLCKEYKSNYLLADLYCLLGNISEEISTNESRKNYYNKAYVLYSIDDNEEMMLKIENNLNVKEIS